MTSASLVAGAIENARLYEETRLGVAELEQLTELAEAIARQRRSTTCSRRSSPMRVLSWLRAPATSTCSILRGKSSTAARAIPSRKYAPRDARPR